MSNTGVTLLDAANLEEMVTRLGAYRVLMLMQTQLAEKSGKHLGDGTWGRLADAANLIQGCALGVDAIFHGEKP